MKKEYSEILKLCLFVISLGVVAAATKIRIDEGSSGWLTAPALFSLIYILLYWSISIKGRLKQ